MQHREQSNNCENQRFSNVNWFIENERCPITAFFVSSYTVITFPMLKFLQREIIWDKISKILWLKQKKFITCYLWTIVVFFSGVVEKLMKLFCSMMLLYEYAKINTYVNPICILSEFCSWFGNRNFYWATRINNLKNFNRIPTVFIFSLVFKGLLCWKDNRDSVILHFQCP